MSEPIILDGRTPRLSMPFLYPAQAQKEYLFNEAISTLDCLVSPRVLAEQGSPPSEPADGNTFIVGSGASGEWADHHEKLAYWAQNHWLFIPPREGMSVYDASKSQFMIYTTEWTRAAKPDNPDGGTVIDAQARMAIAGIIAALENTGVFSQS